MCRFAIICALSLAGWVSAHAQGSADLMKTPECLAARKQLDEALAAGGPRERLTAAREQAGIKCLGQKPPPLPEGRFVPPPAAVDPIRLRPALALSLPSATAPIPPPPPPPLAIPRAPVITSCDAAGCGDSNGTHYNQLGPVLLGPRGVCTVQGGALNCP